MIDYTYTFSDFVGNIGVVLLISSFYLNMSGKWASDSLKYSVTNLIVAILLTINLFYKPNLSALIIEFFWALISLYGIYNYFNKKDKE